MAHSPTSSACHAYRNNVNFPHPSLIIQNIPNPVKPIFYSFIDGKYYTKPGHTVQCTMYHALKHQEKYLIELQPKNAKLSCTVSHLQTSQIYFCTKKAAIAGGAEKGWSESENSEYRSIWINEGTYIKITL